MAMESFQLSINEELFRKTNAAWNRWMLNDPWSVGYVSQLIETKDWKSKEEWEIFYYESGERRAAMIDKSDENILNDFQLQLKNKSIIYNLPWDKKNLNYQCGRTKEDLRLKGQFLFEKVKVLDPNFTVDICTECVRFRTICETWNGIIVRENNTVFVLKNMFPNLEFRKTEGDIDHGYAVDYEVYRNGVLVCGIQIKPKSYATGQAPYLLRARQANIQKYEAYRKKNGVEVITIISKSNGQIMNTEVLSILR